MASSHSPIGQNSELPLRKARRMPCQWCPARRHATARSLQHIFASAVAVRTTRSRALADHAARSLLRSNVKTPDSRAATAQPSQKAVPVSSSRSVRYSVRKAGRRHSRWQTGQFKSRHLQRRIIIAPPRKQTFCSSSSATRASKTSFTTTLVGLSRSWMYATRQPIPELRMHKLRISGIARTCWV